MSFEVACSCPNKPAYGAPEDRFQINKCVITDTTTIICSMHVLVLASYINGLDAFHTEGEACGLFYHDLHLDFAARANID